MGCWCDDRSYFGIDQGIKSKSNIKIIYIFYIKIHMIDCCICKGWSGNMQRQELWLRLWIDCCSFFKKRLFLRDTISVSDVIIVVLIELCYTALHDDDGSMIIMLAALNNNNESTDDLLNTKTTPTTLLLQTVESRYNT